MINQYLNIYIYIYIYIYLNGAFGEHKIPLLNTSYRPNLYKLGLINFISLIKSYLWQM